MKVSLPGPRANAGPVFLCLTPPSPVLLAFSAYAYRCALPPHCPRCKTPMKVPAAHSPRWSRTGLPLRRMRSDLLRTVLGKPPSCCPKQLLSESIINSILAHLPFEHAACECKSCVCRTRPDPNTTVLILPIAFEPFDRSRRQIVGSHSPWRLSRIVGW
jgi:hypothetical protein